MCHRDHLVEASHPVRSTLPALRWTWGQPYRRRAAALRHRTMPHKPSRSNGESLRATARKFKWRVRSVGVDASESSAIVVHAIVVDGNGASEGRYWQSAAIVRRDLLQRRGPCVDGVGTARRRRRHTSSVFASASCSRNTPMVCSSLKRLPCAICTTKPNTTIRAAEMIHRSFMRTPPPWPIRSRRLYLRNRFSKALRILRYRFCRAKTKPSSSILTGRPNGAFERRFAHGDRSAVTSRL